MPDEEAKRRQAATDAHYDRRVDWRTDETIPPSLRRRPDWSEVYRENWGVPAPHERKG